ncbi:MAG TPA: hypothetical protein VN843_34460 [Anaerolineales bacterium]|nr:hypothetical protein [Anaerolineales bacterium]
MEYVTVNRNAEGVCLAVMGPYENKETAEYVANRIHQGIQRGWRAEELDNQFTEYREYRDEWLAKRNKDA